MIRRREFITLLGGAAAEWPIAALAQQPIGRTGRMPRLGMLMPGPAEHSAATLDPFYRGLHELGYFEGRNLAIEQRNGDWKLDRLPALATELVKLNVDVIVAEHASGSGSQAGYKFNPHHRSGHGRSRG